MGTRTGPSLLLLLLGFLSVTGELPVTLTRYLVDESLKQVSNRIPEETRSKSNYTDPSHDASQVLHQV